MSLYNPCSRNHVGKVFYYLFGTIRGVCCQKWSVNRGGGAKEFCDLKITCQFFSVNNTGEITAQYEAIFARYIITDVFVFVCNKNPYLMWNLARSPWLGALISGSIIFFYQLCCIKWCLDFVGLINGKIEALRLPKTRNWIANLR